MNNQNETRALVLYVPNKERENRIISLIERFKVIILEVFSRRKRMYFCFLALNIVLTFFFVTLCYFDYGLLNLSVYSIFHNEHFRLFLFFSCALLFSGFTIFGKLISVIFQIFISFFAGSLICKHTMAFESDFFSYFCSLFLISLSIFIAIICSAEVFYFAKRAEKGVAVLFSLKPLLRFLSSELFLLINLNLLFYFCW